MDRSRTTDELKRETSQGQELFRLSHQTQEAQAHLFSLSLSPSTGVSVTVTDLSSHMQLSPVHALLVLKAPWASKTLPPH